MNILFALYHDFLSNSAGHVHSFANELAKLGHDCLVAVPEERGTLSSRGVTRYRGVEFKDVLDGDVSFTNGRPPDLVHAWTPREIVRRFCQTVRDKTGCRLYVHMEDNEWHILACTSGVPWNQIVRMSETEIDQLITVEQSHPHKAFDFMTSADGITVIIDRLRELIPPSVPVLELWPAADSDLFRPLMKSEGLRRSLGIPKNNAIVVYTGNVHGANAHEMRSLYLAIAMLNREGQPVTLVRTGRDFYPFLGPDERWARQHSIELGRVHYHEIPTILALADVLVQPGRSDRFNDYRFPSKLPEFMSVGRPVVVPEANIAAQMIHGKHAFILPNANGLAIAEAIQTILADTALKEQLATGALEFAMEHFSWQRSAHKLNEFYASHEHMEQPEVVFSDSAYSGSLLALARSTAM